MSSSSTPTRDAALLLVAGAAAGACLASAAIYETHRRHQQAQTHQRRKPRHLLDASEAFVVGRCKLDPGLKAPCFQNFNLIKRNVLSI